MGKHREPDTMERTRDLYLTPVHEARHADTDRQPGRSADLLPDELYDPGLDRYAGDRDVWDR